MVRILLIIPYSGVKEKFENKIKNVHEPGVAIETTHMYGTPDDLMNLCGYDIVIARGITYRAIRKALPTLHLVEISMTGFDVVKAVAQCRQRFHPQRIAILAHDPALRNVQQVEELSGIPLETYDVVDEQGIAEAIQKAREGGADAFIGGLTMCRSCDALGLPRIHIKTGDDAIERAIAEAVNAAKAINTERAKTKLMQTLFDNSREVIIAVNKDGVITAINNQAYLTYRIPLSTDMVGRSIEEISHGADWKKALETGEESESLRERFGKPYLVTCKPIVVDRQNMGVLISVQNAEQISETETKIRKELSAKGLVAKYHFGNIIGGSETMKKNIAVAYKYSQVDSNLLLIGETGTGKELFAHSIHNASRRSSRPFVAVNCAALPESLLESELFGYVEGAFSGAVKGGKAGLFELAHRGSIFLDEIGEMPILLQSKLLRVLQEKEIRRIGDDRVRPIDVRVISATNIDIRKKIEDGLFRADLYYRLNLLNIRIPPLREHREDIPELINYFVSRFACDYHKTVPKLTPRAADRLSRYPWPGNARELHNLCERLVVLNETGVIDCAELEQLDIACEELPPREEKAPARSEDEEELLQMIARSRMKKEDIAKMMGISRTTLWRKLNKTSSF